MNTAMDLWRWSALTAVALLVGCSGSTEITVVDDIATQGTEADGSDFVTDAPESRTAEAAAQPSPPTVSGPTNKDAAGGAESQPEFASPLVGLLGVPLTFEELLETQQVVFLDRELAIEECMSAQGFSYIPDVRHQDPGAEPESAPYYGISRSISISRGEITPAWESPNLAVLEGFDSATRDAWFAAFGRADQGCQGESLEAHPDSDSLPRELLEEIVALGDAVDAHDGVAAAWAEWSACMRSRGYDIQNRAELIDDMTAEALAQNMTTDEVVKLEGLAWFDDETCENDTGLSGTVAEIRYEIELEYVENNASRIALLLAESP